MDEHADSHANTTTRSVLLLRAGGRAFAIYAEECECVTPWAEPAPLPHAPAPVLGVAPVRGRMRTVLDPSKLFEASGQAREHNAHAFIVSLTGDEQLALACESSTTSTLVAEHLSPSDPPAFPALGTFQHDGETVHLLDPARLFDAAMSGTERRRQRAVNSE
ncbi:MAG: chemotaxis protein CheW [Acidobacteria bacterium]|nr:chemotaxis protein CheW [Acidobacteriota bacterium]